MKASPLKKRVAAVNAIEGKGYYLRIDHGTWGRGKRIRHPLPALSGGIWSPKLILRRYSKRLILCFLRHRPKRLAIEPHQRLNPQTSPRWHLRFAQLIIRVLTHPPIRPALITKTAYAIFLGTLQFLKERKGSVTDSPLHGKLEIQVVDSTSQHPVVGAKVTLDGTFPLVTDQAGQVIFRNIPTQKRIVLLFRPRGTPTKKSKQTPRLGDWL